MISFTDIFRTDCSSGIEVEGFWIMFSSVKSLPNVNLPLSKLDFGNGSWDNSRALLRTNTIYSKGRIEVAFIPDDIYLNTSTTEGINSIKSWYLVYRLPILEDKLDNYRIAAAFNISGETSLSDHWYMHNVIVGNVHANSNIVPISVENSKYSESIIRRELTSNDSDASLNADRELFRLTESDQMFHGLINTNNYKLII